MDTTPQGASDTAVPVRAVAHERIVARSRLTVNWTPNPGIERHELDWSDLVEGDPPPAPLKGSGSYIVPLRTEVGRSWRRDFSTRVVAHADGTIEIEEVVSVRPRFMLRLLHEQRRRHALMEEQTRVKAQKRATNAILRAAEVGGMRGRMHRAVGRVQRRHTGGLKRRFANMARWWVELPDHALERMIMAGRYLGHGIGRKELRRGLRNPRALTVEGKSVLLLLLLSTVFAGLLWTHLIVTLAAPGIATEWRSQFFLFNYGLISSISPFPLPFEPLLVPYALDAPRTLVAAAPTLGLIMLNVFLSRALGAYLLFFLGDEANEKMEAMGRKRPWVGKAVKGLERFAQRFGFTAAVVLIAIPITPDNLVMYVLGSAKMSMRRFMSGVLIGTVLRYGIVLGAFWYFGEAARNAMHFGF